MIRPLILTAVLAAPLQAQTLPGYTGQWQGEGTLTLADEPEQRFQCRLRLNPLDAQGAAARSQLVGRCATAQGSQSVNVTLTEAPDGSLTALSRTESAEAPPAPLTGIASAERLTLEGSEGQRITLAREGAVLRFTLSGQDRNGPTRGEAVLHLRD